MLLFPLFRLIWFFESIYVRFEFTVPAQFNMLNVNEIRFVLNTNSFVSGRVVFDGFERGECERETERECELLKIFWKYVRLVPRHIHECRCQIESMFPDTNNFKANEWHQPPVTWISIWMLLQIAYFFAFFILCMRLQNEVFVILFDDDTNELYNFFFDAASVVVAAAAASCYFVTNNVMH